MAWCEAADDRRVHVLTVHKRGGGKAAAQQGGQITGREKSGDNSGEGTPVPISNTAS